MTFEQITVVLQGPVRPPSSAPPSLDAVVASVRRYLPGAKIILSTWAGTPRPTAALDDVVYSADPGALPDLKKVGGAPNNVNRQIVSTRAGLGAVTTSHALKMRTDCLLTGNGFVGMRDAYPDRDPAWAIFDERVLVPNFYTINPRVLEQIPFHVSDWFQFGRTDDLRAIWDCPLMTLGDATYFQRHAPRPATAPPDAEFNARFAIEQYLTLNAVRRRRPVRCEFLNDLDADSLRAHDRVLANAFVLVEMEGAGFSFPKNDWARRSWFHWFNCYTHADWRYLYRRHAQRRSAPFVNLPRRLVVGTVILIARSPLARALYAGTTQRLLRAISRAILRPSS